MADGLTEEQVLVLSILSGMNDAQMKEKLMLKHNNEKLSTDKILIFADTMTLIKASTTSFTVKKNTFEKFRQFNRPGHTKEKCNAPQCGFCQVIGQSMQTFMKTRHLQDITETSRHQ